MNIFSELEINKKKNIPTNFIDVVVYEIYMSTVYAINMRISSIHNA